MKDFDKDRNERATVDRTFRIGGEQFEYRASIAPETIMRWTEFASDGDRENTLLRVAQERLAAAQQFDPPWPDSKIAELRMKVADAAEQSALTGKGEQEWIQLVDDTALAIIRPEDADKWHHVRNPDAAFPLSLEDLQGLLEWLIGEAVGRPTQPPSASTSPDDGSTTSSTVDSSSQEATELPVSTTDVEVESVPSTPDSTPMSSMPS